MWSNNGSFKTTKTEKRKSIKYMIVCLVRKASKKLRPLILPPKIYTQMPRDLKGEISDYFTYLDTSEARKVTHFLREKKVTAGNDQVIGVTKCPNKCERALERVFEFGRKYQEEIDEREIRRMQRENARTAGYG
jgi:hypothetical protein